MKVSLSCAMILGVIFALALGCGSTDNPVAEDIQEPPTEPPTNIVSPILGDWRLMNVIWFADGVLTNHNSNTGWIYGANLNILTFAQDGIFNLTQRYPIQEEYLDILEWKGKGHIQEIIVTFRGKYRINANQLWLNPVVTRVEPREEALEYKGDLFEEPFFLYDFWANTDIGTHGKLIDYSLADDGNQLELRAEKGTKDVIYAIKLIHRRRKTD